MMHDLAAGERRIVPLAVPQAVRLALVADAAAREAASATVRALAAQCTQGETHDGAGTEPVHERVSRALAIVQRLEREPDPAGGDVLAGPLATLARGAGDCLTLSGVLHSILLALNVQSVIAAVSRPCDEVDHVVVYAWVDGAPIVADPASNEPFGRAARGIPCLLPERVKYLVR